MFNSTLMDFDLDLLGAQPSNELQGYCEPYVQHMENDKKLSLTANGVEDTNIALLEDTSDLKALFDIGSLPQDDGEDVNVERVSVFTFFIHVILIIYLIFPFLLRS